MFVFCSADSEGQGIFYSRCADNRGFRIEYAAGERKMKWVVFFNVDRPENWD